MIGQMGMSTVSSRLVRKLRNGTSASGPGALMEKHFMKVAKKSTLFASESMSAQTKVVYGFSDQGRSKMHARSSSIRAVVSAALPFVSTPATHVYSATRLIGMASSTQSGNIGVFILINNHLGESCLQTKWMLLTNR
jgi:hypothetical protein